MTCPSPGSWLAMDLEWDSDSPSSRSFERRTLHRGFSSAGFRLASFSPPQHATTALPRLLRDHLGLGCHEEKEGAACRNVPWERMVWTPQTRERFHRRPHPLLGTDSYSTRGWENTGVFWRDGHISAHREHHRTFVFGICDTDRKKCEGNAEACAPRRVHTRV